MAVLMPTYARPRLVSNAIALFRMQTLPAAERKLFILDDGAQLPPTEEPDLSVSVLRERLQSLPDKYAWLVDKARREWEPTHYAIVDDDDIILPHHLSGLVTAMDGGYCINHPWAKPPEVWSTYTGKPVIENAAGRFWASIGFTADALAQAGGFVMTKRGDFDQLFLRRMGDTHGPPRPALPTGFVFRWADTGVPHSQSAIRYPEDENWYDRMLRTDLRPSSVLAPSLDEATIRTLAEIEILSGGY